MSNGEDVIGLSRMSELFELGRAEEARLLLDRLRADPAKSPRDCEQVANLLVEQGDFAAALRWYNIGLRLIEEAGSPETLTMTERILLVERLQVRRTLGLPADSLDEQALEIRAAIEGSLDE